MAYAAAHIHANATNGEAFPGPAVFTGRSDTVLHFLRAMMEAGRIEASVPQPVVKVRLERIPGAKIQLAIPLSKTNLVLSALQLALSGTADRTMFTNVLEPLEFCLQAVTEDFRETRFLMIAFIPEDDYKIH